MREQDIRHENGKYWVGKTRVGFAVFVTGVTHSVSDSEYAELSLAVARCDYLAKTGGPEADARRFSRLSAA